MHYYDSNFTENKNYKFIGYLSRLRISNKFYL